MASDRKSNIINVRQKDNNSWLSLIKIHRNATVTLHFLWKVVMIQGTSRKMKMLRLSLHSWNTLKPGLCSKCSKQQLKHSWVLKVSKKQGTLKNQWRKEKSYEEEGRDGKEDDAVNRATSWSYISFPASLQSLNSSSGPVACFPDATKRHMAFFGNWCLWLTKLFVQTRSHITSTYSWCIGGLDILHFNFPAVCVVFSFYVCSRKIY